MIVLSCKGISKSYGITEVLKDITFSIMKEIKLVSLVLMEKENQLYLKY